VINNNNKKEIKRDEHDFSIEKNLFFCLLFSMTFSFVLSSHCKNFYKMITISRLQLLSFAFFSDNITSSSTRKMRFYLLVLVAIFCHQCQSKPASNRQQEDASIVSTANPATDGKTGR